MHPNHEREWRLVMAHETMTGKEKADYIRYLEHKYSNRGPVGFDSDNFDRPPEQQTW